LSADLVPGSLLIVVGVDAGGAEVARLALRHGADPTLLLAGQGWQVLRARDVIRHPVERQVLTMTFVVEPSRAAPPPGQLSRDSQIGEVDQVRAGVRTPFRHQRVAAYALVTSSRGLLMTQFSDRTGVQGQWGLPGGGLEAEEAPERAVMREVWEESGQVVEVGELALVETSHWVGHSPAGRLEDFHAVRVVYRAVCPLPTDPVVHDVDGTTEAAAWWLPADLGLLALTSSWRSTLSAVVTAPEEADGPDHRHHHTDADDRPRPQP